VPVAGAPAAVLTFEHFVQCRFKGRQLWGEKSASPEKRVHDQRKFWLLV